MIIGCCGAGKSTFAFKLQAITGLNLIHLDRLFWKPNWVETEHEEWRAIVEKISEGSNWIIDGNYDRTMDIRIQKSDTIIYFDFPTWLCLYNVVKRIIKGKYFNGKRPDCGEGCNERFEYSFFKWVLNFNKKYRPKYLALFTSLKNTHTVVHIKNYRDAERFLLTVSSKKMSDSN